MTADQRIPSVAVFSFASCFGCQLQITNQEQHLLDLVGQIELRYWAMTTSAPMPSDYDIAIIEGALTTEDAIERVRRIRELARVVIAIGACATTGGIPGMAAADLSLAAHEVYGDATPEACGVLARPRAIDEVIPVDYKVLCCPVDFYEVADVLHQALIGSNKRVPARTMCGDCRRNETVCFYEKGELCLGLITAAGCHARCVRLGRPCNGCRGLSPDANLQSARRAVAAYGVDPARFDAALELFNETNEQFQAYRDERKEA